MELHKANLEAQKQAIAVASHQIPTVSNAGLLPAAAALYNTQTHALNTLKMPISTHNPLFSNNPTAVTTNSVNGVIMSTTPSTQTATTTHQYLMNPSLYNPQGLSMETLTNQAAVAAAAAAAAGGAAPSVTLVGANPTVPTVQTVTAPQPQPQAVVPASNAAAYAAAAAAAAAAAYHVTPKLKTPSGLIAVSSGRGTDKFSPY